MHNTKHWQMYWWDSFNTITVYYWFSSSLVFCWSFWQINHASITFRESCFMQMNVNDSWLYGTFSCWCGFLAKCCSSCMRWCLFNSLIKHQLVTKLKLLFTYLANYTASLHAHTHSHMITYRHIFIFHYAKAWPLLNFIVVLIVTDSIQTTKKLQNCKTNLNPILNITAISCTLQ